MQALQNILSYVDEENGVLKILWDKNIPTYYKLKEGRNYMNETMKMLEIAYNDKSSPIQTLDFEFFEYYYNFGAPKTDELDLGYGSLLSEKQEEIMLDCMVHFFSKVRGNVAALLERNNITVLTK